MKTIGSMYEKLEEWLALYAVGAAITGAMLYVSANVIARYVFLSPIKGMVYIVALLVVPIAYFPLAYGWRSKGTFVAATFLLDKIGAKARWVLELLYQLIALIALAGLIGYASVIQTIWAININHRAGAIDFNIVTWPFRVTMIIGCCLLFIRIIIGLIKHLRGEEWAE